MLGGLYASAALASISSLYTTVVVHGKITAFVRYRQMQDLILLNKLLIGDADGKKRNMSSKK